MSTITIKVKPGETNPQLEEIKGQCAKSLWFLCTQFLKYPDWDTVHDDMELLLRRPSKKKAVVIPRNHLKSTFGTIGVSVQQILKNPNVRILIANQVWDMSRSFLREIKAQLEGSQLKYLFGDFVSARWNEDEIIVRQRTKPLKEPTIRTAGVESEQTGGHYDVIILDDLMGLQNSQTPEQREKAKRFRRSMINLLEPGGLVIENLTRWHLDDTFADILEKELKYYDVMVRQVVENGKLIFPKKFSRKFDPKTKDWTFMNDPLCMDYIDFLKASMPLDEFSSQYLNLPFSTENQLFKPEMFKYWNERPKDLFVGMAVDLAISEARTADETAIVICGMDPAWKLYVLDYIHGRWRPSDVVARVFEMQSKWRPHACGMETNGFQRTLKLACEDEMRKRGQHFFIQEIRTGPERSKAERIKTLEPFYRNGDVQHAAWMKGKELEVQLQTFPKGKRDDVCFVAGTKIATPFGDKNIEEIAKGDSVITPFGIRTVLDAKMTGEREVISNEKLTGTKNHPVFVYGKGFISLDALTMTMPKSTLSKKELLLWKYRKLLNSMESNTKGWVGRDAIISASQQNLLSENLLKDFMLRSGNFIQEKKFRRAFTFIIKTGILSIMNSVIWNAYQLSNITECPERLILKKTGFIWRKSAHSRALGMVPKMVVNGIRNMLGINGRIRKHLALFVSNVGKVFSPTTPMLNFVGSHIVVKNIESSREFTMLRKSAFSAEKSSFQMEETKRDCRSHALDPAVENIHTKKPVYNITVDKDHVYFANGILVSNCDAMSMTVPLMQPGVSHTVHQEDEWDQAVKRAMENSAPYRGFFNYDR